MSAIIKKSIAIRGHRTSYSLEQPFHDELGRMAARRGMTLAALVARIDEERPQGANLSSALRLAVLAWVKGDREPPQGAA